MRHLKFVSSPLQMKNQCRGKKTKGGGRTPSVSYRGKGQRHPFGICCGEPSAHIVSIALEATCENGDGAGDAGDVSSLSLFSLTRRCFLDPIPWDEHHHEKLSFGELFCFLFLITQQANLSPRSSSHTI